MNRKKILYICLLCCLILVIVFCLISVLLIVFDNQSTNSAAQTHRSSQSYEIVVHLEDRTLELIQNGEAIRTYSVAVGARSTPTPTGEYEVINMVKCPGGEYGTRWIGLSVPHIGIHGTNEPETIGQAKSEGCIRMLNEDVEELFSCIRVGTKVTITR
jgi:lipoprotein-anchoring transpeptidase ErfK/SrfK